MEITVCESLLVNANTATPIVDAVCIVCGGTHAKQRFVQRGYVVLRCPDCGLEFVAPTPGPAELADYYDHSYAVPLERYAAAQQRNVARIVDLERWCPTRGRLLELGASYGHSLAAARERGWDPVGIELSPTACGYARSHFGLSVYNSDLAEVPLADGSFDAAIMWHVLEHVRNPKDQLLRLAAVLKPGGILGVRVPNVASFGARATGEWWPWMCPPAHLWFFSPDTLPRLLRACGFEVQQVSTLRGDGNNLYQYALMAAGSRLNDLRQRLGPREPAGAQSGDRENAPRVPPESSAVVDQCVMRSVPESSMAHAQPQPSGILRAWLRLLARAQPITNALARGTRPLVERLERQGWGDELLVYARRIGKSI